VLSSKRTLRRTPPTAEEAAPPPASASSAPAEGTVLNGSRKRARVLPPVPAPVWGAPPPPPPRAAAAPAATPARAARGAAAVPFTPSAAGLSVSCATPGGTGRRMRCVVGRTAPAAPTPGVAGGSAPQRDPQAGEVFFSANGSPLGAFVEEAEAGTPPAAGGGGGGGDIAQLAAMPDAALLGAARGEAEAPALPAGLQSFLSRIMALGRRQAAP